jgi:hypothetical protein
MPAPFLALITPIGGSDGPPLGTWGGAGQPFPTPPMAPGGGGHWGQANDPGWSAGSPGSPGSPQHPIYIPGLGIWSGPWYPLGTWGGGNVPFPTPPMAPGGPPLGTWGGVGQPYPDQGLPGQQPGGPVPYLGWALAATAPQPRTGVPDAPDRAAARSAAGNA